MKRLTYTLVGAALAAVAVLSGCHHNTTTTTTDRTAASSSNAMAMGAMNDKCPVSGKAVNKDVKTASFEGHTVGFCCPGCESQWNAMSTAEKESRLAKSK